MLTNIFNTTPEEISRLSFPQNKEEEERMIEKLLDYLVKNKYWNEENDRLYLTHWTRPEIGMEIRSHSKNSKKIIDAYYLAIIKDGEITIADSNKEEYNVLRYDAV